MTNKMPKNPTMDQKVEWHIDHARNCDCRPIDSKILEEIIRRDVNIKK